MIEEKIACLIAYQLTVSTLTLFLLFWMFVTRKDDK